MSHIESRIPRVRKIVLTVFVALALVAATLALCIYNGIILLNDPSADDYPVRGVDVSAYQGVIDWQTLAGEGISFAYIKATEGSNHVDARAEYNLVEAKKTALRVGAYHFFSFESAGKTQADNYIKNVPSSDGMLPPAVDVEFYGDFDKSVPDAETVRVELDVLLAALEEYYGQKPIIYVTSDSYDVFIKGHYEGYDIWFRNVITDSGPSDGRKMTFWQYTNRERLDGYEGDEKFIDMNVFCGSVKDFAEYGARQK